MRATSASSLVFVLALACCTWIVSPAQAQLGSNLRVNGASTQIAGKPSPLQVDIYWDAYGVPHIFGQTDAQAFYGLGYATAKLRFFQMSWHRLIYQGRLAEFFGKGTWTHPESGTVSDIFVDSDRNARLLGWRRYAQKVVGDLQSQPFGSPQYEAWRMLEAYAAGVNHYVRQATVFHDLFDTHNVPKDLWTAADCVGVWIRMGSFFGPSGLDEAAKLKTYLELVNQGASSQEMSEALLGSAVCDESAPVVLQGDVPQITQDALIAYALANGLNGAGNCPLGAGAPAFSEAWAVAGSHTTTGRAVVVAEPRITVYVPNTFVEWHVKGATFEVRGVGIPGSPNVYVGSTADNAWGLTALNMDQADLFQLKTDPIGFPDQYQLDGVWSDWDVDQTEMILVEDKQNQVVYPSVPVRYRESWWGPVVTELANQTLGEEFARKAKPFDDTSNESTVGFLAMYRATNVEEFSAALGDWSYPSVNVIFGSSSGSIGYWANGHMPVRNPSQPFAGTVAMDGSSTANDWIDRLPHDLLPWVVNPAKGWLHSGNHMPIGSWYPIPNRPGPAGETHRSRRVREALEALSFPETPTNIARIHADSIVSPTRDTVILGLHLRDDQLGATLSAQAQLTLSHLESWLAAGARMDNSHYATLLAHHTPSYFRSDATGDALIAMYGASDSGMSFWLKDMLGKVANAVDLDSDDIAYVDWTLSEAWDRLTKTLAMDNIDPNSFGLWQDWYTQNIQTRQLPLYTTLGSKPELGLDPGFFQTPTLISTHGNTIVHQTGQTYSQFVEVGKTDAVSSILPPGQAEGDHEFPLHQEDQASIWAQAALRGSPTSLAGIQNLGPWTRETLQVLQQL